MGLPGTYVQPCRRVFSEGERARIRPEHQGARSPSVKRAYGV